MSRRESGAIGAAKLKRCVEPLIKERHFQSDGARFLDERGTSRPHASDADADLLTGRRTEACTRAGEAMRHVFWRPHQGAAGSTRRRKSTLSSQLWLTGVAADLGSSSNAAGGLGGWHLVKQGRGSPNAVVLQVGSGGWLTEKGPPIPKYPIADRTTKHRVSEYLSKQESAKELI